MAKNKVSAPVFDLIGAIRAEQAAVQTFKQVEGAYNRDRNLVAQALVGLALANQDPDWDAVSAEYAKTQKPNSLKVTMSMMKKAYSMARKYPARAKEEVLGEKKIGWRTLTKFEDGPRAAGVATQVPDRYVSAIALIDKLGLEKATAILQQAVVLSQPKPVDPMAEMIAKVVNG